MVVPLLPLVAAGAAAGVLLRVATKHRDLLSWRPFAEASGTRDGRLVYGLDPWRTLRDAHQEPVPGGAHMMGLGYTGEEPVLATSPEAPPEAESPMHEAWGFPEGLHHFLQEEARQLLQRVQVDMEAAAAGAAGTAEDGGRAAGAEGAESAGDAMGTAGHAGMACTVGTAGAASGEGGALDGRSQANQPQGEGAEGGTGDGEAPGAGIQELAMGQQAPVGVYSGDGGEEELRDEDSDVEAAEPCLPSPSAEEAAAWAPHLPDAAFPVVHLGQAPAIATPTQAHAWGRLNQHHGPDPSSAGTSQAAVHTAMASVHPGSAPWPCPPVADTVGLAQQQRCRRLERSGELGRASVSISPGSQQRCTVLVWEQMQSPGPSGVLFCALFEGYGPLGRAIAEAARFLAPDLILSRMAMVGPTAWAHLVALSRSAEWQRRWGEAHTECLAAAARSVTWRKESEAYRGGKRCEGKLGEGIEVMRTNASAGQRAAGSEGLDGEQKSGAQVGDIRGGQRGERTEGLPGAGKREEQGGGNHVRRETEGGSHEGTPGQGGRSQREVGGVGFVTVALADSTCLVTSRGCCGCTLGFETPQGTLVAVPGIPRRTDNWDVRTLHGNEATPDTPPNHNHSHCHSHSHSGNHSHSTMSQSQVTVTRHEVTAGLRCTVLAAEGVQDALGLRELVQLATWRPHGLSPAASVTAAVERELAEEHMRFPESLHHSNAAVVVLHRRSVVGLPALNLVPNAAVSGLEPSQDSAI